ncbi:MAG: hypothetical protein O3B43_03385 [Chloroflexi bacterium]|nr:hypothetical protein [Chloroflexota bacterium]
MKKLIFTTLFALALIATACSPAAPEPVEVTIQMDEYSYSPTNLSFRVGQEVTMHLVNQGVLEHELMIGRKVSMHDGVPAGYQTDFFEAVGVTPVVMMDASASDDHNMDEMAGDEHMETSDGHAHEGFMVMLPPGDETSTISFTVTEEMIGQWELGCFVTNGFHYTSGMLGTLIITN